MVAITKQFLIWKTDDFSPFLKTSSPIRGSLCSVARVRLCVWTLPWDQPGMQASGHQYNSSFFKAIYWTSLQRNNHFHRVLALDNSNLRGITSAFWHLLADASTSCMFWHIPMLAVERTVHIHIHLPLWSIQLLRYIYILTMTQSHNAKSLSLKVQQLHLWSQLEANLHYVWRKLSRHFKLQTAGQEDLSFALNGSEGNYLWVSC